MRKKIIVSFMFGAFIFGTAGVFAGQYIATENSFPVQLNEENVSIQGYNIEGSTYFKLRDISDTIGGFDVDFQDDTIKLSKYEDSAVDSFMKGSALMGYTLVTDYEKYNSPASENGLGGTQISICGKISDVVEYDSAIGAILESYSDPSKKWFIIISTTEYSSLESLKYHLINRYAYVSGIYEGFSDVLQLPALSLKYVSLYLDRGISIENILLQW